MTKIVNLKQRRKAKERTQKDKQASENRIKFGRTKEEKKLQKLDAKKAERHLQGHKLETDDNKL